MAGAWLTAIARSLTTRETFEHVAAPTIADLQHEAHGRRAGSLRGYTAVWVTLARAVTHDFRVDADSTFDGATTRRLLKITAWTLLLLVFAPRLWGMAEIGFDRGAQLAFAVASIPSGIATILPLLMLPFAALIAGRSHGRTVLLLAVAIALFALALQGAVIPRLQRAWASSPTRAAAAADLRGQTAVPENIEESMRSGITGQPFGPVFLAEQYRERRQVSRLHSMAASAAAFAFAICGAALRLRRDWAIVAVTIPAYVLWLWMSVFALVWMSGLGFHPVFRGWLPTLAIFALGTVAMAVRLALDRRRLPRAR